MSQFIYLPGILTGSDSSEFSDYGLNCYQHTITGHGLLAKRLLQEVIALWSL